MPPPNADWRFFRLLLPATLALCAAGAALVLLGLLTNAWLRAHPGR